MKFLVLVLAVVPIYATGDVFGDLLGQEFHYATIDHAREKRQAGYRTANPPPPQIQQLIHAQNSRAPLVNIPAPAVPNLGPSQPIQPQQVSQTQASQYRPQVTFGSGAQQPDYRGIPAAGGQYRQPIQRPHYNPVPQQNFNAVQPPQKLPPHIQQLLQYQSSLSNSIPRRA